MTRSTRLFHVCPMTDSTEPRALSHRYEKAGVVIYDQPVPWNVETVVVEASLRLPSQRMRNARDYQLHIHGRDESIVADSIHPDASGRIGFYRLFFRLPPLRQSSEVKLRWRENELGRHTIPLLTREEFLQSLRFSLSALYVRLGEEQVACRSFVANQCRGLIASGVLNSPTCLIPMLDLPLSVEFHDEKQDKREAVRLRTSAAQLAGRQVLLTAIPKAYPKKLGEWSTTWSVGERRFDPLRVRGVSQRELESSIRVSAARYVVQNEGQLTVSRSLPASYARVGPCFLIHGRQAGLAGLASLQIRATGPGQNEILSEPQELISEGLTMLVPGTLDSAAVSELTSFELLLKNKVLATLSLGAAPVARLNSEGGIEETPEYDWSVASDEELSEQLARLMLD